VHSGSRQNYGLIELLKCNADHGSDLELVHRLDQETSGCLLIAKNRQSLLAFHESLREQNLRKSYTALLAGRVKEQFFNVGAPLQSDVEIAGERMVVVDMAQGKTASSDFRLIEIFVDSSLVSVDLHTGRKHQIRVHAKHSGYPVVGDRKYGSRDVNQRHRRMGLQHLFLHASALQFELNGIYEVEAPLPDDLQQCLMRLRSEMSEI